MSDDEFGERCGYIGGPQPTAKEAPAIESNDGDGVQSGVVNFRGVFERLQQGGFRRGPLLVEWLERGDAAKVTAEARKARKLLEDLTGQKV